MNNTANLHPGEVLLQQFLIPRGISQYRLAKEISVHRTRISAICKGKRGITANTAVRLARFYGNSAGFWLGLQAQYDSEQFERSEAESLSSIREWKGSGSQR